MNHSDPVDERRSMEAVKADESALVAALRAGDEPSVDPERFIDGHWAEPPEPWRAVLDSEARSLVDGAIAALPDQQRQVIQLRDVEGWSANEVCNVLDLSETHQRVLLHRARSKVRAALEDYFGDCA